MRKFTHLQASTVNEASQNAAGKGMVIAGGTDLLGTLKDEILPVYPSVVIDLKTIPGLDKIEEEDGSLLIGAMTRLADVASHEAVKKHCQALSEACGKVASPTIRNMATLGGNICQMHRCWYFRTPDDRFHCSRKGGSTCPAYMGDNRYHSIFGVQNGCVAASSHDTAPALIALGATVITSKREVLAEGFFAANGFKSCILEDGEIVTHLRVPKSKKSVFEKFALRKSIDFPIVNCAAAYDGDGKVRLVMGGVYPAPLRLSAAERAVEKGITEAAAAKAGDDAMADAVPLSGNAYKIEIARTMVKRTLLRLGG